MKATDRNKLIDRIKTLEGLTDDERSALLGLLNETKTYGLVWEDKPEEVEERLRTELPVLKEVKSRAIISDNADAPNHILIEGDNLEALTTLAYTHEGKIDVIYIDPPYNTGNKDFIYNDSYVDSEDSYRHSKWLSFMSRRLRIAKRLLSDRGVIFISIDDNEQANLKILCDEIFGQQNFIDIFSWNKTETPANLSMKTKKAVEYILCYCKQRNSEKFRGLVKSSTSNNGLMNQTNSEHILVFPKKLVDTKLPDGIYSKGIYGTKSYHIELLEDTEVKDGFLSFP
ncbi:site-specific DNA-methyltransferase [uncultured Duncaniella sp.]|uniref:site-specific DNA-methyltransferase n=1 Tax=uncultured Duncaniella sp. TaxID=2768039 RepID=UPI00352255F7